MRGFECVHHLAGHDEINERANMVQVTKIQTSGYESVDRVQDSRSGLDGFIAVHSTVRGPALGGLRFRRYRDLDEALADARRLSEAMTYKAAAGLPFGGGKAVVIGDPQSDNAAGLLTESVIPDLRCRAVVGSANNQLRSDDVSDQLADRGIAYVPDFIANAGGVINIASEYGYSDADVSQGLDRIAETTERILRDCYPTGKSTHEFAIRLAQAAIRCHRRVHTEQGTHCGRQQGPGTGHPCVSAPFSRSSRCVISMMWFLCAMRSCLTRNQGMVVAEAMEGTDACDPAPLGVGSPAQGRPRFRHYGGDTPLKELDSFAPVLLNATQSVSLTLGWNP